MHGRNWQAGQGAAARTCHYVVAHPAPFRLRPVQVGRRHVPRSHSLHSPVAPFLPPPLSTPTPPPSLPTYVPCVPQGIFVASDLSLYVVGSVAGMAGTVWGNVLERRMSAAAFASVLQAMVVVCTVLMLASGLGWVS